MSRVTYVGHYGSDLQIALAAWTSTSRELTEDKLSRVDKMITNLYNEGHKTPFERGIVHFLVETDIASHIHLIKHRMIGTNGESARYKELKEDKYYIPEDWPKELQDQLESATAYMNDLYHYAIKVLEPIHGRQRAKESARYFKLYNSTIQSDVTFNLRSFAHFMFLRNSPHAQLEIRIIAQQMWDLVSKDPTIKAACAAIEERNKFDLEHHSSSLLKI